MQDFYPAGFLPCRISTLQDFYPAGLLPMNEGTFNVGAICIIKQVLHEHITFFRYLYQQLYVKRDS